jgi:mono/diheme cytochrome c family protein
MQPVDVVRHGPAALCGLALVVLALAALAQTAPDRSTAVEVEKLFATSCGWCHQGGGRVPGRGPKLAGTDKSDEFIINRIKTGKSPVMPAFRNLSDEQLQAILAYIRDLKE